VGVTVFWLVGVGTTSGCAIELVPPRAAAPPRPPQSPVLHRQRCPPPPPPVASYSPPEKMRCKEVSNFILEKWYENEKVTSSL
jgi:hypothetical protein